jgi:hypothetical protein
MLLRVVAALLLLPPLASADERDNGDAKPFDAAASTADLSSAVKACLALDCKSAHGSGVHLGNGYFLTAAHVAEQALDPEGRGQPRHPRRRPMGVLDFGPRPPQGRPEASQD